MRRREGPGPEPAEGDEAEGDREGEELDPGVGQAGLPLPTARQPEDRDHVDGRPRVHQLASCHR